MVRRRVRAKTTEEVAAVTGADVETLQMGYDAMPIDFEELD